MSVAFPEDNLLKKNHLQEKTRFSGFTWGSFFPFVFPPAPSLSVNVCVIRPVLFIPNERSIFTASPLMKFGPAYILLPSPRLPLWLWISGERAVHSDWDLSIHSCLVLAENVIRNCFSPLFHLVVLLFCFFPPKDPVGKPCSLAVLQCEWLHSCTSTAFNPSLVTQRPPTPLESHSLLLAHCKGNVILDLRSRCST